MKYKYMIHDNETREFVSLDEYNSIDEAQEVIDLTAGRYDDWEVVII